MIKTQVKSSMSGSGDGLSDAISKLKSEKFVKSLPGVPRAHNISAYSNDIFMRASMRRTKALQKAKVYLKSRDELISGLYNPADQTPQRRACKELTAIMNEVVNWWDKTSLPTQLTDTDHPIIILPERHTYSRSTCSAIELKRYYEDQGYAVTVYKELDELREQMDRKYPISDVNIGTNRQSLESLVPWHEPLDPEILTTACVDTMQARAIERGYGADKLYLASKCDSQWDIALGIGRTKDALVGSLIVRNLDMIKNWLRLMEPSNDMANTAPKGHKKRASIFIVGASHNAPKICEGATIENLLMSLGLVPLTVFVESEYTSLPFETDKNSRFTSELSCKFEDLQNYVCVRMPRRKLESLDKKLTKSFLGIWDMSGVFKEGPDRKALSQQIAKNVAGEKDVHTAKTWEAIVAVSVALTESRRMAR